MARTPIQEAHALTAAAIHDYLDMGQPHGDLVYDPALRHKPDCRGGCKLCRRADAVAAAMERLADAHARKAKGGR